MGNALASKLIEKSTWLALLLGAACASLTAQSCSIDKDQYTFTDAGASNGGDMNGSGGANGGSINNGGESNAGDSSMSGATSGDGCTVGDHNCTPDGHLQTCKAGDPPAFDAGMACGEGKCSASRAVCLKCAPGEFQCASNVLQQCNIFGSAFEDAAICDSKATCVASDQKGYCVRCKAGTASCEPSLVHPLASQDDGSAYSSIHLVTCNVEGSGTDTTTTCLADNPVCDPAAKKCLNCEPNQYFCDGSQLAVCTADGTNYNYKKNCTSAAACDPVAADCVATECTPGQFQCSGATLSACKNGKFERIDSCDSAALCDANNGRCQQCVTNNYSCVNDTVQGCDYNNGEFTTYTANTCAAGTCTSSGQGYGCTCKVGAVSCYDGGQGYQTCGPGGTSVATTCGKDGAGNQMVCSSKLAKCVTCVPGRAICDQNNGVLKKCLDDGSGYTTENCQAAGKQCDAGRAACLSATPGHFFCTDTGDLMSVGYDASHKITNTLVEKCGSQNQCNSYDGTCRTKRCVVGQPTCSGADVYTCATGERRERSGTRCSSATRCQDGYGCVKVLSVAAGDAHTCVVVSGADAVEGDQGYVLCWGANESGQLGDGSPLLADSKEPRQVLVGPGPNDQGGGTNAPRLGNFFNSVCAGKNFTCAQIAVGEGADESRVACWGSNAKGQLGAAFADPGPFNYPFTGVTDSPTNDNGVDLRGVTCGAEFACALGPDGTPWCWGANENGQLGNGSTDSAIAATAISGFNFTQITAGAHHACGVQADNTVWCWGDGSLGQLGNTTKKDALIPTLVGKVAAAPDRPLALGNDFTLALSTKAAKNPYAWGSNSFGQLGNDTHLDSLSPGALAGLLSSDFVAAGTLYSGSTAEHACARLGDRLFCWGANVFGELGDGSTDDQPSPVQIFDGKTDATKLAPGSHSVAIGGRHTCAITAKGDVLCWGANHRYQLGSNALTPQRAPLKAY